MEVLINAKEMEEDSSLLHTNKSSVESKTHGNSTKTSSNSKHFEETFSTRLMKSEDVKETKAAHFRKSLFDIILFGDEDSVNVLIAGGADVNVTDNEEKTALFYAVQQSYNESVVRALINAGTDVNKTDNKGKTPLFYAVQQSINEGVVRALIDAGADVDVTDNKGKSTLFYAVLRSNNESVVHALIDAGADVNITDNEGRTALFYAVLRSNNESVVHALIAAGADVNITDNEGKTTLFNSVLQSNNESVIYALNAAGADVNITDNEGKTALFYAVQSNNSSLVRALIANGADVNITDNEGKTALIYAVQSNNENVVLKLIHSSADVNRTDNEGKTALFYGVQSNNESVVRALIEHGKLLTSPRDIYGRTPLFYAMTKSQSIISYLLEKKVNMRIIDNGGMNFLSFFVDHCISKPADFHDVPKIEDFISERIDLLVHKFEVVRKDTVYEAIMNIIFCKCPLLSHSGIINVSIFIFFLELAKRYGTGNESYIDVVLERVRKTVDDKTLCRTLIPQILDLLCHLKGEPNSADTEGNTALHHAASLPFYGVSKEAVMDLVKKLEEVGITVDSKNHQSETPLLFCLTLHSNDQHLLDESSKLSAIKILVEVCEFLISNGSSVEETTKKGDSVLHLIVKLLMKILESHGNTRLKDAVQVGIELFKLFSSTSAAKRVINKKDEDLNSPIHLWALLKPPQQCLSDVADGGSVFLDFMKEVLKKLLDCGTKLDEQNKHGQTPLHLCRTWAAVELLLDSGANPNVVDVSGRSPLIVAAQSNSLLKTKNASFYEDVVVDPKAFWKTALEKGLDPWVVDKHGNSVLSYLIESEAVDLAKAMIDVFCANKKDFPSADETTNTCTILNIICKDNKNEPWKQEYVEKILQPLGKPLFEIKWSKTSPLHSCCRNIVEASKDDGSSIQTTVHWAIAKLLLLHEADCAISDETGQSCLEIAEECSELKDLLNNHVINDDTHCPHPWVKVSERYRPILEKVARHQESTHAYPFWYYKDHLGVGSFGLIFAGINENDGREVAIKRIEKLRMKRPEDRREIKTLSLLAHCDQVVQYLSFFEDEHFSYIVLELMEGNLNDYLDDSNIAKNNISLCKDLVKGQDYLHGLKILHRDLKPSNILYKKFPRLTLKIADFGLSHHVVGSTSTSAYASFAGTRCWMAPELLKCTDANSGVYTKGSDMFSCGLILHYMLSVKKHPFAPADSDSKGTLQVSNETEANILNGRMEGWDDSLCPEAAHLVKAMLDGDEKERPSADKALDHPFFWSKKKKLDLLIAVGNQPEFEYFRAGRSIVMSAVVIDLETRFGTVVKYGDWNDPGYVHMPVIYTEKTRRRRRYKTNSVVELVRFIRNAYSLVSESTRTTLIRKQLLEDFVFLEYFPNLVIEVYKAVTTHGWDQTREEINYAMKK